MSDRQPSVIRRYQHQDEVGWLRCRALSFLSTPYFDDVRSSKDRYENPAIELVAESGDLVVGLLDVELEPDPGSLCWREGPLGSVNLHVFVDADEATEEFPASTKSGLKVVNAFAHYTDDAAPEIATRFKRVQDCVLYELSIT